MTPTAEQVMDAALGLADGERIELVEALTAFLQPTDRPPFDESWREVIRRRLEELASRQVASIPWSEVKMSAREACGG